MTEILDIVNMNDEVQGQGTKQDIADRGLFGRIVAVVVMNDEGSVFVQWRSIRKKSGARLFDISCTGHVKAGESYEEGAVRELKEELGIDVKASDLHFIEHHINEVVNRQTHCYLLHHNGPFEGWEAEADHVEWFAPYEISFLANKLDFACTKALAELPRMLSNLETENETA